MIMDAIVSLALGFAVVFAAGMGRFPATARVDRAAQVPLSRECAKL